MQNQSSTPKRQNMDYLLGPFSTGDYPSPPGLSEFDVGIDSSLRASTHFSDQVPDPIAPFANFSPVPTALSEGYSPASYFTNSPPTSFDYPTPRDDEGLPLVRSPASSADWHPYPPSQSFAGILTKDEYDIECIKCGIDPRATIINPRSTRTHNVSNHGGSLHSTASPTSPTSPPFPGNEIPGQGVDYHSGPFPNGISMLDSHPDRHGQLDWSKFFTNTDDPVTVPNERPNDGAGPRHLNGSWEYPPKVIVLEEARNTSYYPNSIATTASRSHKTPKRKPVKHEPVEKPYKCDFPGCTYTSDRPFNLKTHQKTHGDNLIKDFACPYCDYASTRKYDRDRHVGNRHRELHASTNTTTASAPATPLSLTSPLAGREEPYIN